MFGYHDEEEMIIESSKEQGVREYKKFLEKAKLDVESIIVAGLRTFSMECDGVDTIHKLIMNEWFYKGAKWAFDWIINGCKPLDKGVVTEDKIIDEEPGIVVKTLYNRVYRDDLLGNSL